MTTYNPYALIDYANTSTSSFWEVVPGGKWVQTTIQWCYQNFILHALARLYLYGPQVGGWGFWQGRTLESICAQLTRSSEDFWRHNMSECQNIVAQQFGAWVVLFEFLLYAVLIWKLLGGVSKAIVEVGRTARGARRRES